MSKILTPTEYPGLPKWPAAFVTGKSVTAEQAKDILFRTDTSLQSPSEFGFGNDKRFADQCTQMFGWKPLIAAENELYTLNKLSEPEKIVTLERLLPPSSGFNNMWDVRAAWCTELGIVPTEYVCNSWLANSYIGGPHGWCSPEGNIHSDGHNYGKWPSVEAIVTDWMVLVAAFPYLDLACTLYSGEQCEDHSVPVCTIRVVEGKVTVYAPDLTMHDRNPTMGGDDGMSHILGIMRGDFSSEHGWPLAWVREFGVKSTTAMKKVAPWL
jgi:hypothetical protein